MSDTIEHLTGIIERCMTNAPNPTSGARLAAYRVTDELRKAMLSDEAMLAARDSGLAFDTDRGRHYVSSPEHIVTAAWDAVLEDEEGAE